MPKTPQMSKSAANPSGGSLAFETIPLNYVVDTQGEFRWWLEPQAIYDGINYDIADRGYAMGFFPTKSGTYTFVQGQRWIEMNLAGRIVAKHPLPPGLAGRYERRVIWHENASGDPALMWLIAMLRSASAQEACAGGARRPEG